MKMRVKKSWIEKDVNDAHGRAWTIEFDGADSATIIKQQQSPPQSLLPLDDNEDKVKLSKLKLQLQQLSEEEKKLLKKLYKRAIDRNRLSGIEKSTKMLWVEDLENIDPEKQELLMRVEKKMPEVIILSGPEVYFNLNLRQKIYRKI